MDLNVEKRVNRSDNPGVAINLLLECNTKMADAKSMLIVDEDGLLIAESEHKEDNEEIAVLCPSIGRGENNKWNGVLLEGSGKQQPISVWQFNLGYSRLYLCCLGGNPGMKELSMNNAIEGVKRILDFH